MCLRVSAQSITNYTFSSSSGTFTALSGATSPGLSTGTVDDGTFTALPIGFDFWYMGTRYTTISASTNGWAALGSTITDTYTNNLATGGTRPLIAPLWDDVDIQTASNFSYLSSGTSGSRVFTMQWLNTKWQYTAFGSTISFQVKLYESSGKIEFIYRSEIITATFPSASVGIAASATGSGSFLSVNNTGASVSSTVEASVTSKPASGTTYGFTPAIPVAPSGLTFSGVTSAAMTLNWTDNASNEIGFAIYRSTDGVNYSFVSQTAANVTTSAQSGLSTSTTYYWKVYAVTEGGLSTALSGTQATSSSTATYSNYAFSKALTLNNVAVGMSANQTNFPVLLSIQDNALIINSTCSNYVQIPNGPNYDFAFMDPSSGTELNYQVESYNQTTGTLLVWVKIPTLYAATNNTLAFYFGSLTPPTTHNTAFFNATWPSDYQAVYHFNEAAYTGTVTDNTSNGHTGTTSGMTSADLVTGKIGNAYSFNGSSKSIAVNPVNITGTFTISAWVKLSTLNLDQKIMTNQGPAGYSTGGYKLGVYSTNIPEVESGVPSTRGKTPTAPTLTSGTWYYMQGVFSGTALSIYVNGSQYAINTTSVVPFSTTNFYIGAGEGGNQLYFSGLIDEPRVSNVGKSSDWIKAEYIDQNNPSAFISSSGSVTTYTTNAAAISGALTYTWTGASSTNPTVAANWNNTTAGTAGQLPAFDGTATLVIPTGLTLYPSLTADASVYGLTIASGASLNLNGHILSVGCNIYNTNTGTINWNSNTASSITWNGSAAAQTYNGSSTTATAQLGSMTINNSAGGTVTINSGPLDIYNSLTITKGNLVIGTSPAALTLKSTATLTATVKAITTGYGITGTANVERFLTGGSGYRGYRLLSSPIYGATVSSNNVYSINYIKNSSYITGTTGTTGGFDKAGNPTLYLYRENLAPSNTSFISGNSRGINTIGTAPNYSYLIDGDAGTFNIPVGNGVLFFFRGDRSVATLTAETTTTYTPTNTTLTSSGTLNQGQIIVKDWYTPSSSYLGWTNATANTAVRGFNLVGNPYASSIDWETFNTTTTTTGIYANNIGITIYELNPATKNFDTYQKGGIYTNNGSNIIASGQGFFVRASNSTNPQLIFNESAKTNTQNTGINLFMTTKNDLATATNTNSRQYLRLQLAKDSINRDDIYIGFNSSAKTSFIENEDAPYRVGTGTVSLSSISADNIALAINLQALPKNSETIPLKVNAADDGIYKLTMTELKSIPQLFDVWLMDAYKKDSLDMRHNSTYAFNLYKNDTTSFGPKRFSLVIRQNPAYAYRLLNFTAAKVPGAKQVQLIWKTENEQNYTKFTVERSTDGGKTFEVTGGLVSGAKGEYSLQDKNPMTGSNLYRLKQEDFNNTITYSKVVTVLYSDLSNNIDINGINVYPNPASNTINLVISPGSNKSGYNISITNNLGLIIKEARSAQGEWQTNVKDLLPGTYVIEVLNSNDKSLVGKTKFIKLQ